MDGPVAQIVALTCHANAALQGRAAADFFPGNSTTRFCERIRFVETVYHAGKPPSQRDVAATPGEWFAWLKEKRGDFLRLFCQPGGNKDFSDRMTAGLIGGGRRWIMDSLHPKKFSRLWGMRWEVGDQQAQDQRIWRVDYVHYAGGQISKQAPQHRPLSALKAEMHEALRDIHGFSARHKCDPFTENFAKALETLMSDGKKRHGYYGDLAPPGLLPPEAQTLLDACQPAWVFGAMGSWNDMAFEAAAQQEYERLSDRLFDVVNDAIAASASATGERA
jgi:hypothetical protein